ncbi:MAG: HlyD family efflux transporter periplasmic adaptor subunit, partial [Alphaproteobacteria bacterium]|nr:HlyD family efflux transporter periplasmic adaptor subunit [Alphaproteobacteria bacterium]
PFNVDELALGEAIGSLVGPVLELKEQQRKLLSGRLVEWIGTGFTAVFGPGRPALKLGLIALLAAGWWLHQANDMFRLSSKSILEGAVQRAAVAPFDGFVAQAPARAGDVVQEGQVLAVLDDKDLTLERMKWISEQAKIGQRLREAHAKHDRVNVGTLSAQLRQADAQLSLAEEKLARTRIRAPIAGIVVSGDLSQMLGSPVERGKVLFEVAPLDAYRVIVQVDEKDVRHLAEGQTGELSLNGLAGRSLPVTVRKLTPVTKADEGRNFFRVEAELHEAHPALRPGMEGVAKIAIGERPLWWIWSRTLIEWVQLTWWKWIP